MVMLLQNSLRPGCTVYCKNSFFFSLHKLFSCQKDFAKSTVFSYRDWETMLDGFVSCKMMSVLAFSCMEMIQTFAEAIIDAVMPSVYTYIRTHGGSSETIFRVPEDQIQTYMGNSVKQALNNCLKVNIQDYISTKVFCETLIRHISNRVNSVLALFTQSPNLQSRLPVFYVSGCLTNIIDLKNVVFQMATILMTVLYIREQTQQVINGPPNLFEMFEPTLDSDNPALFFFSRSDLKKLVKTYIIRMFKVLQNSQSPPVRISSSNHRDICIRVGANTNILTVEESELHEQMSPVDSLSGLDSIPGAVSDRSESPPENCPFLSVTVIRATEYYRSLTTTMEMDIIMNIADELIQTFLQMHKEGGWKKMDSGEMPDLQLEDAEKKIIRQFTGRIFDIVMKGHDYYQIPLVPVGTQMCDTVTYRRLQNTSDKDIIAHVLYMKTEEVVTRCVVQVLLWSILNEQDSDDPSPLLNLEDLPGDPDFFVPRNAAGDRIEEDNIVVAYHSVPSLIEPIAVPESAQSALLEKKLLTALVTQLVGRMLIMMDIRDNPTLSALVTKITEYFYEMDPSMYDHFYASLLDQKYGDNYQTTFNNLLLEFDSLQAMQEAVMSGDPSFEEAMIGALTKQLRFPRETPVSCEKSVKKSRCGFFKKVKKWCCKKRNTTTVISLTTDQEDNKLQGK